MVQRFVFILIVPSAVFSQISSFPYNERFDTVTPPTFPAGWTANGFYVTASAPKSLPNAVIDTGNQVSKHLTTPTFDFSNRTPDTLVFQERRTTAALGYRLQVRASTDGTTFPSLLASFDTILVANAYTERKVVLLGSGLAGKSNVKFQWQFLGDNSNNTGLVRLDDIAISVQTTKDLSPTRIQVTPPLPTSSDSVSVTAIIKNLATQSAPSFTSDFFLDDNSNGVAEGSELFASFVGSNLGSGDSISYFAGHPPLKAGEHRFIVVANLPQDENATNDTLSTVVSVGYAKGALLINEFMYAPVGDEPEWVELFNPGPDTVNMKSWRFSDNSVSTKTVITNLDALVPPNAYAIIAKDVNISAVHPSITSPIFIANFAALNNTTPDAVVIYDARSFSIDSLLYAPSWGGQNGKSLERIDNELPAVNQSNWATSNDSSGSTPGRFNSVGRLQYDLAIGHRFLTTEGNNQQVVPVVNAYVKNIGKLVAASYMLNVFADTNRNSMGEPGELLASLNFPGTLSAGDSALFSYTWDTAPSGESFVFIAVSYGLDLRTANNTALISVQVGYESRELIVNEIMYDPLTNQNEWIELYHRGTSPVDIANWKFSDRPTTSGSVNSFTITTQSTIIQPGDFVVVAAESSILQLFPNLQSTISNLQLFILNRSGGFSLGNEGDDVVLKDLTDATIDSTSYSPSWHHPDVTDTKGRSVERISPNLDSNDPRNWSTATGAAGGSPGKSNSILTTSLPSSASLSISPNPFSPDGDGFEDFCSITYNLPSSTSLIHLRIFDIRGRLIRTLANTELSGPQGEIIWDGLDDGKQRARIGPYIVLIEALDSQGGAVHSTKAVAVVAAKL